MANEYGDHADVETLFKGVTLSGSTTVTDVEVDTWSDQFARTIDMIISTRYTTPVTDLDGIKVLTLLVANLSAARLKRVLNADDLEATGIKNTEADKLEKQAWQLVQKIADGKVELFDAGKSFSFIAASYNVTNEKAPLFEKETDQW